MNSIYFVPQRSGVMLYRRGNGVGFISISHSRRLIRTVSLHLEKITDLEIEDNPFDNLVLDIETKSTIEALVWNYVQVDTKVQAWNTDFVKNKGEGRIFLLHGSPGVGKTYVIIQLARMPLCFHPDVC
jgi:flagellar biosynthesis GTPase FlhF